MKVLLIAIACFLLGCGDSGDSPEPVPSGTERTPAAAPTTPPGKPAGPADRMAATRQLYSWPEGSGPARDKEADLKTCQERVRTEHPELATKPALLTVAKNMDCMEKLGWKVKGR